MADSPITAPDVNDVAWDPTRDSALERRSLLGSLDPLRPASVAELLDPDRRTMGGHPLGARSRALLLGCTVEDVDALVDEANVRADTYDDPTALLDAIDEYEALLGAHRLTKRDSDERTLGRMPVHDRRRARALGLRIDAVRRARYEAALAALHPRMGDHR